jgi:Fe2+ or Zn2+ uptake regulation protein
MAWVLSFSESEGSDRLVLLAIANHADADGMNAFPNAARIADEARVGRATVYRAVRRLVALGEVVRESGGGRGRSNRYSLPCKGSHGETLSAAKPSHAKQSQGSQVETVSADKGSHLDIQTVSSAHINGLNGETRTVLNRQEPKTAIDHSEKSNGNSNPRDRFPDRCPDCQKLLYDCLCDRGPLKVVVTR